MPRDLQAKPIFLPSTYPTPPAGLPCSGYLRDGRPVPEMFGRGWLLFGLASLFFFFRTFSRSVVCFFASLRVCVRLIPAAAMTRSTRRLRKRLTAAGIEFKMPLDPAGDLRDAQARRRRRKRRKSWTTHATPVVLFCCLCACVCVLSRKKRACGVSRALSRG